MTLHPDTAGSWVALLLALSVAMWPILLGIGWRLGRMERADRRKRQNVRIEWTAGSGYPRQTPQRWTEARGEWPWAVRGAKEVENRPHTDGEGR